MKALLEDKNYEDGEKFGGAEKNGTNRWWVCLQVSLFSLQWSCDPLLIKKISITEYNIFKAALNCIVYLKTAFIVI